MRAIIGVLGVIQMAGGIIVAMAAKSAIHEILGSISFGMGTMCVGLAIIIAKLEHQVELLNKMGKPSA